MNLNTWFEKGITPTEYKATLSKHKDGFNHIYNHFSFPEADTSRLSNIEKQNLRVLIIAQEFCGHCMLDVPIMHRIAEATNMPVSMIIRDDHLDLMDQYLTNEKRVIPIMIFINEAGVEVAKWGPLAPEIKAFMEDLQKDMPDKDDPNFEAAFQALIQKVGDTFKNDEKFWNYVYEDIMKEILN